MLGEMRDALRRRGHRPKPRINMNRPLSHLATRAAYGASQLPRIAWYLGHGLAMARIAQRARESGSARPRPHTDARTPDRKRFFADMGARGGKTSLMSKRASIPCPRIMTAR
jgi:hypothetical protein